ncbi:MAG TPA: DUF3800 domain-containing protein [Candidatus Elarobacter sp.]|jgi:hypothetical protein
MYLLYLDESGSVKDASQQYFVLAGVALFERQTHWLAEKLEMLAARIDPADPASVELHGSPMLNGHGPWKAVPRAERIALIEEALSAFAATHSANRVFAAAVRKAVISPEDPINHCFEQLSSRFDRYLMRLYKGGDTHRGLIFLDKSSAELTLQRLAHRFRSIGHTYGRLRNLAEVPAFLDSRASRLIQLADLVAYAVFRAYERQDTRFYDIIKHRFDAEGGVVHGLYHR